jgi:hypothetical protein
MSEVMEPERSPSRRGERSSRPLIMQAQREALYLHALGLLAQISRVHLALRDGDSSEVARAGTEFEEDRALLTVLTAEPSVCDAELAEPSAALRRSLARLRESAAAELAVEEMRASSFSASAQTQERARVAISTCDQLLGEAP